MICAAPFCGRVIAYRGEWLTGVWPVVPLSVSSSPRYVPRIDPLITCRLTACRMWATLRAEELAGSVGWLEHKRYVERTRYQPEPPAWYKAGQYADTLELLADTLSAGDERAQETAARAYDKSHEIRVLGLDQPDPWAR